MKLLSCCIVINYDSILFYLPALHFVDTLNYQSQHNTKE